jgi:hypothetical protein
MPRKPAPRPTDCQTCGLGSAWGRLRRVGGVGPWECSACYMYRRDTGLRRPDRRIVRASARHEQHYEEEAL